MVVVVTNNDHPHFQWDPTYPVVPIYKEQATYFTYSETPDYVPVYLDLAAIDRTALKEIGLNLNGVCKGAVAVKNDLEQLNAYLGMDESLDPDSTELVLYYESSKNQPQARKTIYLSKSMLRKDYINGNPDYPVYYIVLTDDDMGNPVETALSLRQNYPNPFNPTTRISYSLKYDGKVSLDIFNVKGQLVKTLVHGNGTKGNHDVIWNGEDQKGHKCSSGVYLYKLKTQDKTLTRKMMLMK